MGTDLATAGTFEHLEELVVLVDEDGRPTGTAPKALVHTGDTPLHRAFSCYVFDEQDRLLLTRRASHKRTFPGYWTNTVCGHPAPGETDDAAVRRRAAYELGLAEVETLTCALPDFRYRAEHDGVVENEVCPVYLARSSHQPRPHGDEVGDHAWVSWPAVLERLDAEPAAHSPWLRLQVPALASSGAVERFLSRG